MVSMCGRYTLNKDANDVAKRFNTASKPKGRSRNYNVAPSQVMPVVTQDENGKRQIEEMKWGIPRKLFINGKSVERELINTRADKAFGGFWKRTVLNHRCLVPATSFFEWMKSKEGKIPFLIHPMYLDMYAFAGIWDIWENENKEKIKAYSIMTTEPNKEMKSVHDRMPVILHPEDEASWIESSNNTPEDIESLLFPFEDDSLEIYRVSTAVNNPKNNDPSLLVPISA